MPTVKMAYFLTKMDTQLWTLKGRLKKSAGMLFYIDKTRITVSVIKLKPLSFQTGGGLAVGTVLLIGEFYTC